MSNLSCKEKHHTGLLEIHGVVHIGGGVKIITHMVQRHNDHYAAPEEIDGSDPCTHGC